MKEPVTITNRNAIKHISTGNSALKYGEANSVYALSTRTSLPEFGAESAVMRERAATY